MPFGLFFTAIPTPRGAFRIGSVVVSFLWLPPVVTLTYKTDMPFASGFTAFPTLEVPVVSIRCSDGAAATAAVIVSDGTAAIVVMDIVTVAIIASCCRCCSYCCVCCCCCCCGCVCCCAAVAVVHVVVVAAAVVVVSSNVNVTVRRPICRLHWFLQHILHSKWRQRRCGRCFVRA